MTSSAEKARVAVFVDGSSPRKLGFHIATERLRHVFDRYGTIVDRTYYTGTAARPDDGHGRCLPRLSRTVYSIDTKAPKTITHEDGSKRQKANVAVEIAIDMVPQVDNDDLAIREAERRGPCPS